MLPIIVKSTSQLCHNLHFVCVLRIINLIMVINSNYFQNCLQTIFCLWQVRRHNSSQIYLPSFKLLYLGFISRAKCTLNDQLRTGTAVCICTQTYLRLIRKLIHTFLKGQLILTNKNPQRIAGRNSRYIICFTAERTVQISNRTARHLFSPENGRQQGMPARLNQSLILLVLCFNQLRGQPPKKRLRL